MPLLKITNGFDRLPDAALMERSSFIYSNMEGNPSFPSPWPTMPDLLLLIQAFRQAVATAATGDRILIAEKRQKRFELVDALHVLGYYVLFASRGNAQIVLASGYELAKDASTSVLLKPAMPKVENTDQDGQLLVRVKKVKGAIAYIHQYTTDPELKKESWTSVTTSAVKCKLTGLQPGSKYYIKVGAIGTRQQVMYSDVVSRIAA